MCLSGRFFYDFTWNGFEADWLANLRVHSGILKMGVIFTFLSSLWGHHPIATTFQIKYSLD